MNVSTLHCINTEQLFDGLTKTIEQNFTPSIAIVFTSPSQDIAEITRIFSKFNIDLIGCTTAGEIIDDQLHEGSIAVFIMDIAPAHYKIVRKKYDYSNVYEVAHAIGQEAKAHFEHPGLLVLSSGLSINAEEMISGLKNGTSEATPIYGGLASDDLNLTETTVFTQNNMETQSIVALVLNTDIITIKGLATSGWKAVGGVNTVTKAVGNKVLDINGEPAFTVFSRYFGFSDNPSSNQDELVTLQINYPFQFIKANGERVLRSPLLVDKEEGSITLSATVNVGDQFKFSYAPEFSVIEQTIEEFSQLKQAAAEADGVILFSCKGRHGAFGPLLAKEIAGVFNYWKKPMAGFLSYGEIGNNGSGICEFHNETCSLVILKEK